MFYSRLVVQKHDIYVSRLKKIDTKDHRVHWKWLKTSHGAFQRSLCKICIEKILYSVQSLTENVLNMSPEKYPVLDHLCIMPLWYATEAGSAGYFLYKSVRKVRKHTREKADKTSILWSKQNILVYSRKKIGIKSIFTSNVFW